jgi:hypothetical protein
VERLNVAVSALHMEIHGVKNDAKNAIEVASA